MRKALALTTVVPALLVGCSVGGDDQAKIDAARRQGQQEEQIKGLQREQARLQKRQRESRKSQGTDPPASRSSPTPPTTSNGPQPGTYRACDANISVQGGNADCRLAENAFYEYWTNGRSGPISVYDPTTGSLVAATCSSGGGQVTCTTGGGASLRFSEVALDAYNQSQADRYASTHKVRP